MKSLLFVAAVALAGCTSQLGAITTVSSPTNGATVTSPFIVSASAQTCASVPTVSMAYSIDSGTDTIEPASFTASALASTGPHVLHVKCWGKGTFNEVLLNITVAAPVPVTNIRVQNPSNGATLTSPFALAASVSTCASKPAVSMGYSIDNGASTIEPTSFTASVMAAPGSHILHVKCWGQNVTDQALINLNVVQNPTATPVLSLPAATYNSSQILTIVSATPGASIYFTTDGSAPSTASALYTGPLTIAKSQTVQAMAAAPGYLNSGIAGASYTITFPAATPAISLPSGTYSSSQTVTMMSSTPGASIHFTLDGSVPSTASAVYAGPLTISKSQTVQAIASAPGYANSGIAGASYTISIPAATPALSLASGTYNSSQTLTMVSATPGASIYFTMDGSAPSTASALYTGPLTISKSQTVQAIASAPGYTSSGIVGASYTISLPAGSPTFSVPSGTYNSSQTLTMVSATPGASIYFTTDGSAPSTASPLYSGPLTISKSETVQAIATAPGYQTSLATTASYTISVPKGPQIPSYANVEQQIDLLPNWRIKQDPAMPGTSSGSMTLVSDPTLSGQTEKYYTTFTNAGGTLYSVSYGNDTDSTNFVYDINVWIASGSVVQNLEMDNNQVMRNGDTVIYAFQCSAYSNTWEYTENSGTREAPQAHWLRSTQPCNPTKWTRDTWHHIQISTSRDDLGNVTYHSVWFDGVEAPINQTVNSDFALGWGLGALVANFQVDGVGTSGSSTVYVDNLTMDRW